MPTPLSRYGRRRSHLFWRSGERYAIPQLIMLMYLHRSKEHISLFMLHGEPLFFQHFDGPYFPTLRLLHRCAFSLGSPDLYWRAPFSTRPLSAPIGKSGPWRNPVSAVWCPYDVPWIHICGGAASASGGSSSPEHAGCHPRRRQGARCWYRHHKT